MLHREWVLGGRTLSGLVLDGDSRPVPDLELWVSRRDPGPGHDFQGSPEGNRVTAISTTDDQGRFQINDLEPGTWWIGPAPASGFTDPSTESDAVVATATAVEVLAAPTQEITLRVTRGRFIRGKVLDPDGKPDPRSVVFAMPILGDWGPYADTDGEGGFAVGPLEAGRFWLVAGAFQRFANSAPVEAEAGASDVVLRLKVGGGVRGRIIDSRTGKPRAAQVMLTPHVDRKGPFGHGLGFDVDDGEVERHGLSAGGYDIGARTEDGCFGFLHGITVVEGETGKEFELFVTPGGTLKLHYDGPRPAARISLRQDGAPLDWGSTVDAGRSLDLPAPAGTFSIEVEGDSGSSVRTQSVHLDPGEIKEIRLTDRG